ncbi:MAG TPA: DUF4157 domain-containing protein [Jatrophihabitans sp.]|jgi:hypothetical protein|uniref:eCIS core domain-containing protein n=1 Tax=Jatrophihabitans sp. TaxID=1932789 RepID=UPI002F0F5A85
MTEAGLASATPDRDSARAGKQSSDSHSPVPEALVSAESGAADQLSAILLGLPGLSHPRPGQDGRALRRSSNGEDRLGGQAVPDDLSQALRRRRGAGQALPPAVAADFGGQLGIDLGAVRIHTDAEADRLSRSIDATAFTAGSDVYFSAGAYSPGSPTGQHTLAHELAHVAQQHTEVPGGPVIGRADDPAEAHADRVASQVVSALRRQARPAPSVAHAECLAPLPALRRQAESARRQAESAQAPVAGSDAPIRRLFAYEQSTYKPADPRLQALIERLPTVCAVPKEVLSDYQEASELEAEFDLVAWLGERGVTPLDSEQSLAEAVGQTLAMIGFEQGVAKLQGLATGLFESAGKPVVDVPGAPALKHGGAWLSRDELLKRMRAKFPGFAEDPLDLAAWRAIPLGTEFKQDFEIWNMIGQIRRAQATELAVTSAAAKSATVVEKSVDTLAQQPGGTPVAVTSLAGSLPQSEQYEDEIGKLAARHRLSLGVAEAMSERVLAFIREYSARRSSPDLFVQIGTASLATAGAVGVKAATVEAALREGTLHERLTHVLNFGNVLANLLIEQASAAEARQAAQAARFDAHQLRLLIEVGTTGMPSREQQALRELKDSIVKPLVGGPSAVNERSESDVGIPFSDREREHWGTDIPQFEMGSKKVAVDPDHPWVKEKQEQGFPVRSGPSTHTFELFEMTELLGLRPQLSLEEVMLAATGYLLPISAHSLIEIQHVAEQFGMAPVTSPELYGRLMLALRSGATSAEQTRKDLATVLAAGPIAEEEQLAAAHHYLLSHGYSFVGYHGTDGDAATSIKATGFLDTGTRKADDPWRGVYVAPDVATASGYLKKDESLEKKDKKPPELLRVYAPTSVVSGCIQARLPLEDSKVQREIGRRLTSGSMAPPHGDHLLLGREHAEHEGEREANSLEAVLSWSAALQCVAIPSLHKEKTPSAPELGLPQQVRIPEQLSFEDQNSSGGLDLRSDADRTDPRGWQPSEKYLESKGDWDLESYAGSSAEHTRTGPNARETEILRALGVRVAPGMSWAKVAEQTLQKQANASTLLELLPELAEVPLDSPLWTDFVYRFASAEQPSAIEPGLYLSGWKSAMDLQWQQENVGAVLNCCQYVFPQAPGVSYERVNVVGYNNGLFEWASQKIAAASKGGILVHCVEGKNRSATVLAAYLMKAHRWNATRAAREVVAQRPWADPDLSALIPWERRLADLGLVMPPPERRTGKGPATGLASEPGSGKAEALNGESSPSADVDWPGQREAMLESLRTQAAQTDFESVGATVGLDRYLTLHNSPGTADNCLIYSIAHALRLVKSEEEIAEIGVNVRHRRIGVERDGFLNAAAIPYLLDQLGAAGTRVILLDTTGRVSSPQVLGADTYSAEVVNARGADTVVVVNVHNVHFGYGLLRGTWAPKVVGGDAVEGNQWIQFEQR